jgi:hypothetical protein
MRFVQLKFFQNRLLCGYAAQAFVVYRLIRRSRKRGEKENLPACRFLRQTLGKMRRRKSEPELPANARRSVADAQLASQPKLTDDKRTWENPLFLAATAKVARRPLHKIGA